MSERQSAAITARDLARAAGVADGALYNHFGDKHDLILAALVRRFERLVETFRADVGVVDPGTTPASLRDEAERVATALLAFQRGALPMLANVLAEPSLFARFMTEIHRPPLGGNVFAEPVRDLARVADDRGQASDVSPAAVADLLVGTVLLLALVELLGGRDPADTDTRLRACVHALIRGLARHSPA